MNRRQLLTGAAAAGFTALAGCVTGADTPLPAPPVVAKDPVRIEQLGRVRVDEYAWIKDRDWLKVWADPSRLSANIRAHLDAETAYANAVLAPAEEDRKSLYEAMAARTAASSKAPAIADGLWEYYETYTAGAEHPIYMRRKRDTGAEQVMLDSEFRSKGKEHFHISHATHSPDHRLFAWTEDDTGAERFVLSVKDIETGAILTQEIKNAFGDFVFSPDSATLYWTWRDEFSRPARAYATPARGGENRLVYEEKDPGMFLQTGRTSSGQHVYLIILNADSTEIRLLSGAGEQTLISPRTVGHYYEMDHWGDAFVFRTNADGAVDFKVMQAPVAAPGKANWEDLAPHAPGRVIVSVTAFKDHLVQVLRVDAKLQVVVSSRDGRQASVPFPDAAYVVTLQPRAAYAGGKVRLIYQSPRMPMQWMDVDLASGVATIAQKQEMPVGFNADDYVLHRLDAPSTDGAMIPIAVLAHRTTKLDGSAPMLLAGYGSYGYTQEDEFSLPNTVLADRGWVVAFAHVRGGGERGRKWYEDARQTKKGNSFVDFNACVEFLVDKGYANPRKVVSYGHSAGGLLVATAMDLRPDLYAGVIARAPYVDCLNTMSDTEHPLAPLARPDWGNPLVDPVAYDAIAAYSPYEVVSAKSYPAVFASTTVADDRVGYWEPAKWIARLRAHTTGKAPLMVCTLPTGGHMGTGGRYGALEDMARYYAFAMWAVRDR